MMTTPDLTIAVHPRPSEDTQKLTNPALDRSPPVGPAPLSTAADEGHDREDGFLANLAFLVRFAFGRY